MEKINLVTRQFARPNNTTAYTTGDVVGSLMSFGWFAREGGGSGYIVGARLETNKKLAASVAVRVHLFSHEDVTIASDNASHNYVFGEAGKHLGYFDLPEFVDNKGASEFSMAVDFSLAVPIQLENGGNTLYVLLETLNDFTPMAEQIFSLALYGDMN